MHFRYLAVFGAEKDCRQAENLLLIGHNLVYLTVGLSRPLIALIEGLLRNSFLKARNNQQDQL